MDLNGKERDIVCLPDHGEMVMANAARSSPRDITQCYVAGWGKLWAGGNSPDALQSVHVKIYSDQYCLDNSEYPATSLDLDHEFCAGEMAGGKDSCQDRVYSILPNVCFV
mgnify:CR=1 FL=1